MLDSANTAHRIKMNRINYLTCITKRPLTQSRYLYYINSHSKGDSMANILDIEKQITVISALAEGSSIRSIDRVTGIHRETVMRLGVRVGQGCAKLLDAKMRDLSCQHLQFDEIWGF